MKAALECLALGVIEPIGWIRAQLQRHLDRLTGQLVSRARHITAA